MSDGNKIVLTVFREVKLTEYDSFFTQAESTINHVINENNNLDDTVILYQHLAVDLRKQSLLDPPPDIGFLKVEISDEIFRFLVHKRDIEVPQEKIPKSILEQMKQLEEKSKTLFKRLGKVRQLEGLEQSSFAVHEKNPTQIVFIGDKEVVRKHERKDYIIDLNRSLSKFNDGSARLALKLRGDVTIFEAVHFTLKLIKQELTQKNMSIKLSVHEGRIKFDEVPENLIENLPENLALAWKYMTEIVEKSERLTQELPEFKQKFDDLVIKGKELEPKFDESVEKVKEKEKLNEKKIERAKAAVTTNLGIITESSTVLTEFRANIKDICGQTVRGVQKEF